MVYRTNGVCAAQINFEIVDIDGVKCVKDVSFMGGCNGNTKGVSALVDGMPVKEVIAKLDGIKCGYKATSCPDQLAKALQLYV